MRCFLEDGNVALRQLELLDVDGPYLGWFDDEFICYGNNHHRFPYSKKFLENYINSIIDSRNDLVLAIIDKNLNIHVGNIALSEIDLINSTCNFSVIIGNKESWSSGIGFTAASLIINHAFNSLNLNRINIGTYDMNIGMQKLAIKLKGKKEGVRRQAAFKNGKYLDIFEYGILKEEWVNRC